MCIIKTKFCSLIVIGLVIFGILIGGCSKTSEQGKPPAKEEYIKLKDAIEIKPKGEILQYQKESFWTEEHFSKILKSKYKFESEEISSFKGKTEKYNVHILNPKVEFDAVRKVTVLSCNIKGAMYSSDSYEFHWLLADLPFDLYQFKQHEKELIYKGKINGIPTTIKLIFPYTITHCHEHVWPK